MNMNTADENRMREMIQEAVKPLRDEIKEHNGKHEQDMKDLKPYMQFASGLGIFYRFLIALGALAAAVIAIKELAAAWGSHITIQ